jgi:hypothetical protein
VAQPHPKVGGAPTRRAVIYGAVATMSPIVALETTLEPTAADLDGIVDHLKSTWTSRITVRRQSQVDIGFREIYVLIDGEEVAMLKNGQEVSREVKPGKHLLRVHNTLFRKTVEFTVKVGEHATFMAVNRRGLGTYSIWAFFLGGMPIYLSLEREDAREGTTTEGTGVKPRSRFPWFPT